MLGFGRIFSLVQNNVEFFDALKNNVGSIASMVTVISAVVGAYMYIDSSYVKAEDFKQYKEQQQLADANLIQQQRQGITYLRMQYLEDKIFELQAKGKLSPTDQAILQRYLRQREDLLTTRGAAATSAPAPTSPVIDTRTHH